MAKEKYTEELADQICEILATSDRGLVSIGKELGFTQSMVYRWLDEFVYFREKYTRAREMQADFMDEQISVVANHTEEDHTPFTGSNVIQRDRLRIDALKWRASKLAPKKYGDKIQHEVKDVTEQPLFPDTINKSNGLSEDDSNK